MAVEGLEVGLTAAITVQEQAALNQGGIHYTSDKGSRHGDPPQPAEHDYKALVIEASTKPWDARLHERAEPDLRARFYVHWQGNKFGEMGGAYVQLSLKESSEFHEHGSSLNAHFDCLDTMPKSGDDPRLWSMQWTYEGNFDPLGVGQWSFTGKFEIDAFGGFRALDHVVRDDSLVASNSAPTEIVRSGFDHPSLTLLRGTPRSPRWPPAKARAAAPTPPATPPPRHTKAGAAAPTPPTKK